MLQLNCICSIQNSTYQTGVNRALWKAINHDIWISFIFVLGKNLPFDDKLTIMSSSRRARLSLRRLPRTPSPLSSRSSSSSRSRSPCSSRSNSPYWRPPSPPGPPPKTPPSLSSSCPSSPTYSPLSTPSSPPRSSDLPKPPSPSLLSHPSPQMCPPTFSDPSMFSYPPPLHSNLIRPPTDFTQTTLQCPVWPTMPNPCALQYSTSSATPLTSKFAVTNSTTHYSSGFNASSNRITSRPMPENFCWRPLYRDSYQQTQCHYDYTSANNYPKPVPENSVSFYRLIILLVLSVNEADVTSYLLNRMQIVLLFLHEITKLHLKTGHNSIRVLDLFKENTKNLNILLKINQMETIRFVFKSYLKRTQQL